MEILSLLDQDRLFEILNIILVIIGGASLIVAGLQKLAPLTETDKDDKALSFIAAVLKDLIKLLDKIALNPRK